MRGHISIIPDDTHQAEAITTEMWKDSIRVVISMCESRRLWRSSSQFNERRFSDVIHTNINQQTLSHQVFDDVQVELSYSSLK